jgi:hypothetical protein
MNYLSLSSSSILFLIVVIVVIVVIVFVIVYVFDFVLVNTKLYSSLDKSEWTYSSLGIPLLHADKPHCNADGCPTTTKDNAVHELYSSYHDDRVENIVKKKNVGASAVGPANLFILRHAERVKTNVGLDCNGIYRSTYIIDLIKKFNKMGYGIDYIVTANPDINTGSMHIEQTVMMASWLFNIPMYIFGSDRESNLAVMQIYNNKIFNNKNVLICWEHSCIQSLLANILRIGPSIKNKADSGSNSNSNSAFIDKKGNLALPYWHANNFQTAIHLDEDFVATIYSSGIETCYNKGNSELTFGKAQDCNQLDQQVVSIA